MKKWQEALIWLIGIGIVVLIALVGMKESIERQFSDEQHEEYTPNYVDAEKYYEDTGKVFEVIDAKESTEVQTEADFIKDMANRGFGECTLYADYSMDGEILDDYEVKRRNKKHPSYLFDYVTPDGNYWTIISINGSVIANPIFYNMQSGLPAQLVISESERIMCYDGPTNQFFEVQPNNYSLIIKVTERIDSETLDRLTTEVIEDL